ncbi:hypothetical protein [Methylobacterium sp. CM6247]
MSVFRFPVAGRSSVAHGRIRQTIVRSHAAIFSGAAIASLTPGKSEADASLRRM